MPPPRLLLRFDQAVAFATEYERNISTGGAFLPTETILDLRELVEVEISLAWRGDTLVEPAEIVYCGPGPDGRPGVAVQFLAEAAVLREKLAPLAAEAADDEDRRRRERRDARIPVTLASETGFEMRSHSRNISETGVLVSADGSDVPVGEDLELAMVDPSSGERLQLKGRVARKVAADGSVAALGIQFQGNSVEQEKMEAFVARVGEIADKRVGTGLAGNIQELGLPNLIQMLGSSCEQGTLVIHRGPEEGAIVFDAGALRGVRLGVLRGTKALMRMLAWESGRFRFYGEVDPPEEAETPLPLQAALMEAMRLLDEARRQPTLPQSAVLVVDTFLADLESDLSKTEEAVLELATARMTVRRILDIIPDADASVMTAVHGLMERGVLTWEDPS